MSDATHQMIQMLNSNAERAEKNHDELRRQLADVRIELVTLEQKFEEAMDLAKRVSEVEQWKNQLQTEADIKERLHQESLEKQAKSGKVWAGAMSFGAVTVVKVFEWLKPMVDLWFREAGF